MTRNSGITNPSPKPKSMEGTPTGKPEASEVGFASGIAVACYFDLEADKMLYTGQVVAVIALIFFILVTYPYYKRKKVR